MSRRPPALLALMFLVALSSAACSLPAAGTFTTPTVTPSPTPTVTPTPTPTPTPVPETRLDQAEWALFIGDWDRAQEAFRRAAEQGADPQIRGEAQLGIGTVHLRAGRFGQAETELTAFLETFPDHPDSWRGHFLRGVARQEAGDGEAAIADFDRYLALRPGRIDGYVHENLGDLLRGTGRPVEAVDHYRAALEADRLDNGVVLQVKVGMSFFEAERYEDALTVFNSVYETAPSNADKATANLLAGRTLEELGRTQEAHERYLDSVDRFPQAHDTYIGLISLVEAGVQVDEFRRGLIDYYAGAYEPALNAFNRIDRAGRADAAVYYYRGLSLRALDNAELAVLDFDVVTDSYPQSDVWVDAWFAKAVTEWAYLGRSEDAIATYRSFVEAAPNHARAPEALLRAGNVTELGGELALAESLWQRVVTEYPSSSVAPEAAFEVGIARYRQDRVEEARGSFQTVTDLTAGVRARSRAMLWVGKTLHSQGQEEAARESWLTAAEIDPTGYYSERARDLIEGRAPFESEGLPDFNVDRESARAEAETWLREQFVVDGPEPLTELSEELLQDPRRVRGDEFWRLGLFSEARDEYESLREAVEGDAEATYRLMHHMLDLGLYRPAIFAARHILDLAGYDDAGTLTGPVYFNLIRFGPYFGDLILPAAAANDFNSLFLLSVVRQESLFEGFVTSFASARGLMQVIPSTGAEIAGDLGWPPNYTQDDLYRPVVSVRFGTHYLAEQRALFEGDLVAALSAYNAGPGNALAWKELAPDDPDLFLEVVRFDEPQLYIQRIYEIFEIYQRLYVTADDPG